ncbi:hypothetical protein BCEN4_60005 [Burkholderia cenocepacia]|nr:hypothetical protein BCEN4_60005 [Burkholderia cenocepacia]
MKFHQTLATPPASLTPLILNIKRNMHVLCNDMISITSRPQELEMDMRSNHEQMKNANPQERRRKDLGPPDA